eukprot:scaffold77928_cov33-Prasinocladus_malaysianus.AAC.2
MVLPLAAASAPSSLGEVSLTVHRPGFSAPYLAPPDLAPPELAPPDLAPPNLAPPDLAPPDSPRGTSTSGFLGAWHKSEGWDVGGTSRY